MCDEEDCCPCCDEIPVCVSFSPLDTVSIEHETPDAHHLTVAVGHMELDGSRFSFSGEVVVEASVDKPSLRQR
jgi:hypothetical protein